MVFLDNSLQVLIFCIVKKIPLEGSLLTESNSIDIKSIKRPILFICSFILKTISIDNKG